jgi:hypothetical protein
MMEVVEDGEGCSESTSTILHHPSPTFMMLFSLWFGLSQRVDRRTYFQTGAGLMFLKYLVDPTVVVSYK